MGCGPVAVSIYQERPSEYPVDVGFFQVMDPETRGVFVKKVLRIWPFYDSHWKMC